MLRSAKSKTELKISDFLSFNDGWCCGRGIKFSEKVIKDAIEINNLFISYGFYETDAFPGEDDEIMVAAYKNDSWCEIIVYKNRSYDFVTEVHGEEKESKESIGFEDIAPLLTHRFFSPWEVKSCLDQQS